MTYNVFGVTLNLTRSKMLRICHNVNLFWSIQRLLVWCSFTDLSLFKLLAKSVWYCYPVHTTSVIISVIVEPVLSCVEFVCLISKTDRYKDLLSDFGKCRYFNCKWLWHLFFLLSFIYWTDTRTHSSAHKFDNL